MNAHIKRGPILSCLYVITMLWASDGCAQERPGSVSIHEGLMLNTEGPATDVAWSSDGSELAAASNYGRVLTIWDRNGHLMKKIARIGDQVEVSPSTLTFINGASQLIFSVPAGSEDDSAFAVWDTTSGDVVRVVKGPNPGGDYPENRESSISIAPDQSYVVIAASFGKKNNIAVYDSKLWKVTASASLASGAASVSVFGHGQLIAATSVLGGEVSIINPRTGAVLRQFAAYNPSKYTTWTTTVCGNPAGDLVVVGAGVLQVNGWYYAGKKGQQANEEAASREAVRMFRTKDGTLLGSLVGAHGPIERVMWDPNGNFVAVLDRDSNMFLWAPWSKSPVHRIKVPYQAYSLAISPGGDMIAVGTYPGVQLYLLNGRNTVDTMFGVK